MTGPRQTLNFYAYFFLILLGTWSLLSFTRIVSNTFAQSGGTDLHSYWYYGHFVRQGVDPYQAYFTNQEPTVPVRYLDGQITSNLPIAQTGLAAVPANTAPMVLILTLFSYLSWPLAKVLWMIFNLAFIPAIPWMTIQLLPHNNRDSLGLIPQLVIYLSFFGLLATRNSAGNGQTALFILVLMMATLFALNTSSILAGVMLGLALSKYSLSLPVFLFLLLFARKYVVVIVALAVQLIGMIGLALLTDVSPFQVANEYLLMLQRHASESGIHLATILPGASPLAPMIVAFTLAVWGLVGYWTLASAGLKLSEAEKVFAEMQILNILILWTLLVSYHREYDAVVLILFIALVVYGLAKGSWRISQKTRGVLVFALVVFAGWMSRPGDISLVFLPAPLALLWLSFSSAATTIMLTSCLGLSIWLLYRFRVSVTQPRAAQQTIEPMQGVG